MTGKKLPSAIQGIRSLGVHLEPNIENTQFQGDCPFCQKEKHFFTSPEGLWDCKRCGENGNFQKFLLKIFEVSKNEATDYYLIPLSKDRGINIFTFKKFNIGYNPLTEEYLLAGFQSPSIDNLNSNPISNSISNSSTICLKRYSIGKNSRLVKGSRGKYWFYDFGFLSRIQKAKELWITEGEWDCMSLFQSLPKNLKKEVAVVGTSSAFQYGDIKTIYSSSIEKIYIAFDNDEAGAKAFQKISNLLEGLGSGFSCEINFVNWPDDLKEGYDVRDLFLKFGNKTYNKLKEISKTHKERNRSKAFVPKDIKDPIVPISYNDAIKIAQKWLYLPDDEPFRITLGTIVANRIVGDPVWLFVVGPPGSMKTVPLESISVADDIYTVSTLSAAALISGAQGPGGIDPSLIPKLDGKTMVVKDFTAILSKPQYQRDEIFGLLRDAYDGEITRVIGNAITRHFKSKFGILGAVTEIIQTYSQTGSMLGERFLRYRIPSNAYLRREEHMVRRSLENISKESKMKTDLAKAMSGVLQQESLIPKEEEGLQPPLLSKTLKERLIGLAQWVALMRGVVYRERYTQRVEFKPTSEVATRLVKQLAKLAYGISLVIGDKSVSRKTYNSIVTVARSTIPDRIEDVIKHLYLRRETPLSTKDLSSLTNLPIETIRYLLQDMQLLKLINKKIKTKDSSSSKSGWTISLNLLNMMQPLGLYEKEKKWRRLKEKQDGKSIDDS